MIKIVNLSYKDIFQDTSFEINDNGITALIGNNGSGKSTLLQLISGLITKYSGKILVDSLKPNLDKMTITFQNPEAQLLFNTVYDDMEFTFKSKNISKEKIISSLELLDIVNLKDRCITELSLGEKTKVLLSESIGLDTKYLLVDEPTAFLNDTFKSKIYNILKDLSKERSIIITTNDLSELIYVDNILIIHKKKVYSYKIQDIIDNTDILTKYGMCIPLNLKIISILHKKNIDITSEEEIIKWVQRQRD